MKQRVLFLCHEATRSGAPVFLLRLIRWLHHKGVETRVLIKRDGELSEQFRPYGLLPYNPAHLSETLSQENIGLIYANTTTNGDMLARLSFLDCPVITHVHELEHGMRHYTPESDFAYMRAHTDCFIAPSGHVKRDMVRLGIDANKIVSIREFIPLQEIFEKSRQVSNPKDTLGIPQNAFLVTSCATAQWRKGTDIFFQLASQYKRLYPHEPVFFLWIGGPFQGEEYARLRFDYEHLNIQKQCKWIDSTLNPYPHIAASDVFVLSSREDPYPLVGLEAALLQKPLIVFEQSGGMTEFIGNSAGFVIPYLNVRLMAETVHEFYKQPHLKKLMGRAGAKRVREYHDLNCEAKHVLKLIQKFTDHSWRDQVLTLSGWGTSRQTA